MDASERRRRVSAEPAEWWARPQAHGMPSAEREQFVDWLRESAIHVAEMLRIAQVHNALEQFQHWERIATGVPTGAHTVIPLRVAASDRRFPFRVSGDQQSHKTLFRRRGEGSRRPDEVLRARRYHQTVTIEGPACDLARSYTRRHI